MENRLTLLELQDILGERILLANSEADPAERKAQNEQSQIICSLAKQMINNADVVLRAEKLTAEYDLRDSALNKIITKE